MWWVFFGSLAFLFTKFILFCREELAAFIVCVDERNNKNRIFLFVADIENNFCYMTCGICCLYAGTV